MGKNKKSSRNFPNPDDVTTGRIRLDARELAALIHHVNPTGLGLDRQETARRYLIKSRLQSVFIRQFAEDIDAVPERHEPGVVSLHYRPLDLAVCHAMLSELDEDARSRLQHVMDTREEEEDEDEDDDGKSIAKTKKPSALMTRPSGDDAPRDADPLHVSTMLDVGRDALENYDYETARNCFETAFNESHGALEAALALLNLLVEQLGVDDEALALEGKLDKTALNDRGVRTLLALAAARQGERARAIRLIETGAIAASPQHIADVFVHLSRHALAQGDFVHVTKDLARVKEACSTHPELPAMMTAVAKARTSARGPEEAQLTQLFAAGNVSEAEEQGRAFLVRFPESDVVRRILHAIGEQKRSKLANDQFMEARAAFERDDEVRALSLFHSALATGLPPSDALWARAQIVTIENNTRARAEGRRIDEAQRLLQSDNVSEGLTAYARLPEASRRKIVHHGMSSLLTWLDELCPSEESGKVNAAVAAVLALDRATNTVAANPSTTLEIIAAHDKMLQGFGPAEDVRETARKAWTEQQRLIAKSRMDLAQSAFATGDPHQTQRILNDIVPKYLSEEDNQALVELQARTQETIERRALYGAVEQYQQIDPLRALGIARRLAQRAENDDAERINAICTDLRARTRQAFSVSIEAAGTDTPIHLDTHGLSDARILPRWKFDALLPDPQGGPDDLLMVLPQARAEWIFVRVVEVSTGKIRTRIRLRTPITLDPIHFALRGEYLIMVGRFGGVLELDMNDWSISQWSSNILPPVENATRTARDPKLQDLTVPDVAVDEAAVSTDGRYLWLCSLYGRFSTDHKRRIVHILEIDGLHHVRDIRMHLGVRTHCRSVLGLEQPTMVIIEDTDERAGERTTFYDPRGRMIEGWTIPFCLEPSTLTACPDRKHVFGATSEPDGPEDAKSAKWGFLEMSIGNTSPLELLPNVTAIYHVIGATSIECGMTFLFFCMQSGNELIGLQPGATGLEVAYRVWLPRYSALIASRDGRQAALLVTKDNGHEIIRLGKTAPQFDNITNTIPFLLPKMPMGSLFTPQLRCHRPAGARATAMNNLEAEVRKHGRSRYPEVIRAAMKRGDPDELVLLEEVIMRLHEPAMASDINSRLVHKFPDHPRVRLSMARNFAKASKWSEALERLEGIDTATLDEPGTKHFYHLRGIVRLMVNDPEGAVVDFERCLMYREGDCEPEELLALCVPITDTSRSWSKEALTMRDYLACITKTDAALVCGDLPEAMRAIDVPLVWEANEIQSTGRLAEVYLRSWAQGVRHDPFHLALALVGFCELYSIRHTMTRREMPISTATWGEDKLADIERRARVWIDEELGGK